VNVLVSNADYPFASAVADLLAVRHQVRRIGWDERLDADSATDELVAGIEAVVHFGFARAVGEAHDLIDHAARRTYNLLLAAAGAGVERCIYVSTLRLLEALPAHFAVTEKWLSRPPSDDPALLACHLGEVVAKECARDRLLRVLTLRLGFPEAVGDRSALRDEHGRAATAASDAAEVIGRALDADLAQWQEVHVQSPVPGARYLMREAERLLAFPGAGSEGAAS
jgi:nucleoside-diphosphate-sugar epimerase